MKYKLIVSDYDGTLAEIGAKCTINTQTVNAIKEYEKKGGKFVICTGRPFVSMRNLVKTYNLKGVIATVQGAYICNVETGEKLYEKGLSREQALFVLEKFRTEENATPVVVYGEKLYCEKRDEPVLYYESADKIVAEVVDSLEDLIKGANVIGKLMLLINPSDERMELIHEKFKGFSNEDLTFNYAGNYCYEAINTKFSKKEAVEFLIKYYNLTPNEVMAVGDSLNDVPLVCGTWHGVCVGDGSEELKKIAKEVTVPLKDNPIKVLIEKYCL